MRASATVDCRYCGEPFEPRSPNDAEWKLQGLVHGVPTGGLGHDCRFSSKAAAGPSPGSVLLSRESGSPGAALAADCQKTVAEWEHPAHCKPTGGTA